MPDNAVRELDQLAGHDVLEAVNARDAVADADYRPVSETLTAAS